jgi:hypothetical protein
MKFRSKKGEDKLFEQWVAHGDLSPEATPQKESPEEMPTGKEKNKRVSPLVYILIGAGVIIWCVCLVIVFMQSCE